jgi:PAS domain S-box-containing protein
MNRRQPPPLIPFAVLGLSMLLTAGATAYVALTAEARDRARFDAAVERNGSIIHQRLENYVNLLRGVGGLFTVEPKVVTLAQYRLYVNSLQLERYPGIQGVGVSARIMPAARTEVIARMTREWKKPFVITPPAPPGEEAQAIIFLEPEDTRNLAAIGFNMYTEPVRRAAMEQARDTGEAVTSGKVRLLQELDAASAQPGFLIYQPIYYPGLNPKSLEERRQGLAGFAYAPFRADDMLIGAFAGERPGGVLFNVYDGASTSPDALLHRSDHAHPITTSARFSKTAVLQVPGRAWTIEYRSGGDLQISSGREATTLVLIGGALVSLLLFVLSFSQARTQQRAELAARELRVSESRFRRLVDSNLIGVVFSTLDGAVTDGNDEYFRIIGRRREDVIAGKVRWDQITPSEYAAIDRRAVEQLMATGICTPFEKEYLTPDGSRVPVLVGVAMLEGTQQETVAMIVDLTERKKAERTIVAAKEAAEAARADAEAASRLKDEFLATVSHELRTPLNAIFGWSQLLRSSRRTPEDLEHGLTTIERAARSQAQLIDDLLDVSRIVAGKLRLDMQLISLVPSIEAAMASVRPAADAKGVRLLQTLDPDGGAVNGDPNRLQQIVWNLLSNAVKFTPRGGTVQVSLKRQDNNATIIVADTGIGVPSDFLPHIFERFRQADASTTRKYGGLGLGLAIARHLTELHGGTIEVWSDGEGHGTKFTVRLPLATTITTPSDGSAAPSMSEIRASAPAVMLNGLRVLLVEDDADSRELVVRVLRDRGADVTATSSAADAMRVFPSLKPDVLVSDIGMPEQDGYALIAQIRSLAAENGGHVPAIALTALARPEDRNKALRVGYQVHVPKPVDADELAKVVKDVARC